MTRALPFLVLVASMATAGGCKDTPAWVEAPPDPVEARPAPPNAPVATGANTFRSACANCHGLDGRGAAVREQFPDLPDLTKPDVQDTLTSTGMAAVIRAGHVEMPEFDSQLSDAQIVRVVGYVKGLRAAPK